MQINPAVLASPGKSAAAPARNGYDGLNAAGNASHANGANGANGGYGHDGLNSLKGSQVNRAGTHEPHSAESTQAFGSALHEAMHGNEASPQVSAPPRPQSVSNEHAATPAVPAHVAEKSSDEEETPAADAQLDGGLQAFVNSLQTPVTAMAMPTTATTATTVATADATMAATDAAATSANTAAAEADGVAALAAEAAGKGKAYAFGLDESHGARSRANGAEREGSSTAETGDAAEAADAAGHGKDKIDARDAQASLRAREVAAGKFAPEFRAALNDAQASRPGRQEALVDNGSGSLAQAIAVSASGTPASSLVTAAAVPGQAGHVAPHLHAAQWQDAFGQQLVWMAKNEQQIASLTMNPPDLGPVRVTLTVSDGQASAAFVSLQPEVRQAIQDAVPRLKEMLADAGLQLQQASVDSGDAGRQSASRAQGEDGTRRSRGAGTANDADEAAMSTEAASLRTARSIAASRLVDLFA